MAMHQFELELLTKKEVAEHLKVSEVTVSRWIKQGRLPSYRVGPRAVRVRRVDVDRLVTPSESSWEVKRPETLEEWKARVSRPLTDEEVEKSLQWMKDAAALRERISARRGGVPFPEPIEDIIQEEREKRTRQIDEAISGDYDHDAKLT